MSVASHSNSGNAWFFWLGVLFLVVSALVVLVAAIRMCSIVVGTTDFWYVSQYVLGGLIVGCLSVLSIRRSLR